MSVHRRPLIPFLVTLALVAGGVLVSAAPAAAHAAAATIPASAFLQPADLNGTQLEPADADLRPYLRPPRPGPLARYPSRHLLRSQSAMSGMYGVGENPTVLIEQIALYRGNGARHYLRELRRTVSRPGGAVDQNGRWTVVARGVAGRDSLMLRLRQRIEFAGEIMIQDTYLVVARVHRAVVVLADIGWEIGDGHPAVLRALAPTAVRRAAVLR